MLSNRRTFIIKSPRASRSIRWTHFQTNTLCPALLPWLHSNASTLPLLSTCPNQFHRLLRISQLNISLISANSTTILFVILCFHVIFIIRLRHWHWILFSFRSSAFVIFHVSQPYSRTGEIKVLNRCIFVLLPIPLTAHVYWSWLLESVARSLLTVSSTLQTILLFINKVLSSSHKIKKKTPCAGTPT